MKWNDITFDYTGTAVLVTGGTGGLGAAIAVAFTAAGAQVTITGTRASAADYAEDLSTYHYLQLDIEDCASIEAVAAAIPTLDILVNCAGVAPAAMGLDESDPDVFDRAVAMHLTGVHRLCARLAPKLAQSCLPGGGSVINVASMSSFFGIGLLPAYGTAKTGLLGLTRALSVRWAQQGVRVNAVAAGLTASKMTAPLLANEQINAANLARVPLGRNGVPQDIAGAVLFLCSGAASWITGQTLPIDGGFSISG